MAAKVWRQSFRIGGLGQVILEIPKLGLEDMNRIAKDVMTPRAKTSADVLAARIRVNAPNRTGDLRRGVIVSPAPERSQDPSKIVYDIYFDAAMNERFVKVSKDGKRYYYPASQEYGFKKVNGGRVPGRYYMRDSAVEYAAEHRDRVADGIDNILEEL